MTFAEAHKQEYQLIDKEFTDKMHKVFKVKLGGIDNLKTQLFQ